MCISSALHKLIYTSALPYLKLDGHATNEHQSNYYYVACPFYAFIITLFVSEICPPMCHISKRAELMIRRPGKRLMTSARSRGIWSAANTGISTTPMGINQCPLEEEAQCHGLVLCL